MTLARSNRQFDIVVHICRSRWLDPIPDMKLSRFLEIDVCSHKDLNGFQVIVTSPGDHISKDGLRGEHRRNAVSGRAGLRGEDCR